MGSGLRVGAVCLDRKALFLFFSKSFSENCELLANMRSLLIFIGGLTLGAISWAVSPLLSGKFEPFDSGLAMSVGQVIMCTYVGYIGLRHGFWKMTVAILGVYSGQVAYWYVFGSSEARAWILLGAFTTLLLCVFPLIAGFLGVVIRWLRRVKIESS